MAILLDKAGTQHYANKMVLAENRKVGVKSLPSALADVDNLIEEMKGHFEAEYGSALDMKLENSSGTFSVGTGSGLDKREEVENSFTDIEIKGRTLQNLCTGSLTTNKIGTYADCKCNIKHLLTKENTKYTCIFELYDIQMTSHYITLGFGGRNNQVNHLYPKIGINRTLIENPALGTGNSNALYFFCDEADTVYIKNVMLLEGDYTNTPLSELPYVEGIQGVGDLTTSPEGEVVKVEVKSCGKNIFDGTKVYQTGILPSTWPLLEVPIYVKHDTNYIISHTNNADFKYDCYDKLGNAVSSNLSWNNRTIKNFDSSVSFIKLRPYRYNPQVSFEESVHNLQIEEGKVETTYEPYIEDTLTYTLEEQLHRLPNGVSDEIKDGKLIRRVGKVVLDGSGSIGALEFRDETTKVHIDHEKNAKKNNNANLICDNILATTKCYGNDVEGIFGTTTGYYTVLRKTRLTTQDVDGFRQWLQANPTTVYYELETPITTELPTPSLQCWKNGTISIDSTVPPTTTHTVALNKPAQIKRNIEELTALREKVKTLEGQYDQIALEQAHKLELLNHSFELDYNI